MSGCAQPCQRIPDCHEPSVTGRDLGFIHRKYFEPATWEPLFRTEMGRGQYSKFVASMIERIHLKESSYDEIRSFVHLIAVCTFWSCPFLRKPQPRSQDLPTFPSRLPDDLRFLSQVRGSDSEVFVDGA